MYSMILRAARTISSCGLSPCDLVLTAERYPDDAMTRAHTRRGLALVAIALSVLPACTDPASEPRSTGGPGGGSGSSGNGGQGATVDSGGSAPSVPYEMSECGGCVQEACATEFGWCNDYAECRDY